MGWLWAGYQLAMGRLWAGNGLAIVLCIFAALPEFPILTAWEPLLETDIFVCVITDTTRYQHLKKYGLQCHIIL